MKNIIIIGATSSLAYALNHELGKQKINIALVGRDQDKLDKDATDLSIRYEIKAITIALDLNLPFNPEKVINEAEQKLASTIDGLIILAGYMGGDQQNYSDLEQVARINYVAPSLLISAAAKYFDNNNGGKIIVISSVAGDRGRQSNYPYGSAKAALNQFCAGMRNRYNGRNVHIMTVKPGFLDTPMTYGMNSPLIYDRSKAAALIVKAAYANKNCIYIPFFWRYIMAIIIHIPEFIFNKLKL